MLKMVDGTGIIGVDMICPLGSSTPQPPNYDRVELEGTGMLVLPNSLDAPLERLELGGKTEQVQTTGAQLFEASRYEGVTKNGVTVTVKDGVITATGTPNINTWIQVFVSRENYQKLFKPENKIYLKTNKSKDCNYDFGIYGAFGSPIIGTIREGNSGRVLPAELPRNDTDFHFFIDVKIGTELKGSIKPIVYHDGDGTWEPYTGGKPSPSPEYPQEIKNSGKWNEDKQKYEVDAKFTGKNLFDKDKVTSENPFGESYRYVPIYIGKGTKTVTVQYSKKLSDGLGFYTCISRVAGSTTQIFGWLYHSGSSSLAHNLLQFQANQDTVYLSYAGNINALKNELCQYLQVEISDTQTPYQPYKEQTLTLTSDRPITKWDRLVEQGGEIGWLYQSAVKEYIGDDSVTLYDTGFYFKLSDKKIVNGEGYCKELKQYVSREKNPCINFNMTPNIYAYVLNTQAIYGSTVSAIKEYLKSHPLHLAYKTEIPEFVPLPQSEQNAIRALKTYYPTTVITADGGELDPDIKVTYRKEI